MSTLIAGTALAFFALAMFAAASIDKRRGRRQAAVRAQLRADLLTTARAAELSRITAQRDRYAALYHDAVRTNAALLAHIGDEREAAAREAMVETPLFFDAAAQTELAWLDESTWGQG